MRVALHQKSAVNVNTIFWIDWRVRESRTQSDERKVSHIRCMADFNVQYEFSVG